MKQPAILATVSSAILAAAHGIVSDLNIGGTVFGGYNPFQDPYSNPAPQRIVWAFPTAGNGPLETVSTSDITCNKAATAAPISAPVAAGAAVTFSWTTWPESHKGPAMTYLANCGGSCSTVDPTTLDFFKIDHAGLNSDGTTWASDVLIKNGGDYTVKIPADIKAGNCILRHELLALHSAGSPGGAQFYPLCANLVVSGSGSATPAGVKFPGAYSATDPGILVDIYNGISSYTIPGPAVYTAGGAVAAPVVSTTATAVPTTAPPGASTTSKAVVTATVAPVVSSAPATTIVPPTAPSTTKAVIITPTAAVPTTFSVSTRVPTTQTASNPAPLATGKAPKIINQCLDDVNVCIRKSQSSNGGPVGFSGYEAQRAACYA